MAADIEAFIRMFHSLVAEEMHLTGQGLEDSLSGAQADRLAELSFALDAASDYFRSHRSARPTRERPSF